MENAVIIQCDNQDTLFSNQDTIFSWSYLLVWLGV